MFTPSRVGESRDFPPLGNDHKSMVIDGGDKEITVIEIGYSPRVGHVTISVVIDRVETR